jgi:hypothetical protein
MSTIEQAAPGIGAVGAAAPVGVRWGWLRGMYAANVLGAGVPGALIVLAPGWARENMVGAEQDPVTFGMLGAVWLAIGLLSLVGLRHPLPLAGIFAVQIVYKSVWIVAVALPRLVAGERLADVVPFAIFFGIVVACWLVGAPLAYLLGRRAAAGL